jgi:hypothetical protein
MSTRFLALVGGLSAAIIGSTLFVLVDLAMCAGLMWLGVFHIGDALQSSAPHQLACAVLAGLAVGRIHPSARPLRDLPSALRAPVRSLRERALQPWIRACSRAASRARRCSSSEGTSTLP